MASRSGLRPRPPNAQEEAAATARGEKGRKAVSSKIAVGQENPAAGQFGPLQQGSSNAAAQVGRKGPVKLPKGRSAESKAVVETAAGEEEEVLWVLAREGSFKPDSKSKETPLEIYTEEMVEETGKPMRQVMVLPPWTPKTRLPAEEVDMILSMEAYRFVPDDEETVRKLFPRETDETMEIMRKAVEVSEEAREGFLEYQDWVRAEKEEKGYVEVPNKFIEDRAEIIDWMQEEMDKMIKSLNIPDRYFAGGSDNKSDCKEELALES